MKYLKINLKKINQEEIDLIVDYLNQGKVIVYPTDTVYGLGCDATNKKAVNKILKIKKRSADLGLIILIKSYCMLHDYCFTTAKQEKYIRSIWPKITKLAYDKNYISKKAPTTFILRGRPGLAKKVYKKDKSLAVRLPASSASLPKRDFLIRILKGVNKPIVSTSLNIAGKSILKDVENLDKNFKNIKPDLVINVGENKKNKSSTLIDIRDMNNLKIIRN